MRGTQITMFVLFLLVLTTQAFRHVYVAWIEPTGSVLDEFRDPVEEDIAASKDLDELKAMYAKAQAAMKEYEKGKSLQDVHLARQTQQDAHRQEGELRDAIERWEAQDKALFQLWFYWVCGLASVVLGLLAYVRVNRWIGTAGLITGFVEMTVWTSPLWRTWGPQSTFDRLLTTKLALSFVSLALLLAIWLWSEGRAKARSSND